MTENTRNTGCPIHFDHHSPEHASSWPAIFRQIRQSCPRAWTDNLDGFWIASKYKDIISISQRPEAFSTAKTLDPQTGAVAGGVSIPPIPGVRGIPNESDPPEWNSLRNFLNRRFAPKAVEERRDRAHVFAAALIDMVIERGQVEFVEDLASPLPALVTMDIFGFPLHEWRRFADPFHKMTYTPKTDPAFAETMRGLDYFKQRVDEEIEARRKAPRDDLLGLFASGTVDGKPLDHQHIQDLAWNILAGGVDTTTALTSNVLLYLSRNKDQRQLLIDNPDLLPRAREEFLRYFSPIHGLARNVKEDVKVDGWQFSKGDRVFLAYASANRDDEVFENPERIELERFPNRHIAFGAGMHRCLGSFLARMMFEVMITEVLRRLPDYEVVEKDIAPYPTIPINGWIRVPATFTPGRKVGASIPDR
jgi:cytochrome P450